MKAAIRWMAENHVAANLLMLFFIVGGLVVSLQIKQEVFPDIALDYIEIQVAYPGAGPEEVEEGIILQIEENITGIEGIKEVRSTASEGVASVIVELYPGEDQDVILQEIKSEVDRIVTFPGEAEKPVVSKIIRRREVLTLAVYGDVSERSLREIGDDVRDELLTLPNITQAELGGIRPYEISIEIDEDSLQRYNLTLAQVALRIRQASLDLPGGTIKTRSGEILVRTKERKYSGAEYARISILTEPDGREVTVADLGVVHDSFAETDETSYFDGKPAVMIEIYRIGNQTPKDISQTVYQYVAEKSGNLPGTVSLAVWKDRSEALQSRMSLLTVNGVLGLCLVLVVLGLFLEFRLAMWVMMGIPISFLGAFLFMPATSVSLNMISLFAFIMALGVVVDDAIVVGENIHSHRRMGKSPLNAAVDGTYEVAVPVVFAILTSITAFIPLLYVTGHIGKFVDTIPRVVILILVVSLVECLFVLPAHLGHQKYRRPPTFIVFRKLGEGRQLFGHFLSKWINGPYRWFLGKCLQERYITIGIAIALLIITVGMVKGRVVKFDFMPKVESDTIKVKLEMPPGTPISKTRAIQEMIEEKGRATIAHFDSKLLQETSVLRHYYSTVGSGGSHLASMSLFLIPSEEREIGSSEVSEFWRNEVGEVPGVESLAFENNMVHMGANIDIRLSHEDYDVLELAAARVRLALGEYPGVGDITNSLSRGKRELKITLNPQGRTLGITEEELGRQLRSAFYGVEALRLQRGRDEVKVMVRYPEEDRQFLWNLENMRIRTPSGGEIPLMQAASVVESKGFSQINRADRKRVTNLTGSVNKKVANSAAILEEVEKTVLAQLKSDYPGLSYDLEGESKESKDSQMSMLMGLGMAMLVIYGLLAIPLRSYAQPLLIMVAIPFGIVGAIWGHLLTGYDMAIMSMFGMVALAGVVVNDSLLLIDFINQKRKEGLAVKEAIVEGAIRRFRPILLTSLTTFFGLGPIILETSTQAQFLIPMAISLAFGILFGTVIALVLLPVLYLIFEDIKALCIEVIGGLFGWEM
ncbi:MAG: efflux RND transporter permease subunit [Desulfobulbaceae bacterium]|jgi:multidrug efflux pump subunit AcrB|nr:efflux RND transporter permease subunit [Desulfobulbaceae bacterium]